MAFKLLFIGDVVGRPGRRVLANRLSGLCSRLDVDLVVANGENAAGGAGITPSTARELYDAGVDVITTGDHLWDHREVIQLLEKEPMFLRPLNYPPQTPGQGWLMIQKETSLPVAVVNLQGRTFMADLNNPFQVIQEVIEEIRAITPVIMVDFHAEATSEKIAMGRFLDGKVSLVAGTHTHVTTADEQVFPGGTAYISDVGFTGPQASVLGREIDPVIQRFLTLQPQRFGVASEQVMIRGVLVTIDPQTGKALSIERVIEPARADARC
ncbi:MAG: TIGR00282 family metallophosphoesterase [Limisphaerales bacterium]|jgi:metallophosphoesterase (TIGR00282 family)|nr:TIGR00282 family metallophosphoesterase [Verrucomicrobiota bacterium]HCB97580.1 TIGR00282 family metallophosphoesterase [Verrucomicrobiales bacterium]